MTKIDSKTTVEVFAVIASIPILIGAVAWISMVAYDVAQAKTEIKEVKTAQNKNQDILVEIRDRVIRIETKLEQSK
jgi:hypothetical protein